MFRLRLSSESLDVLHVVMALLFLGICRHLHVRCSGCHLWISDDSHHLVLGGDLDFVGQARQTIDGAGP